MNKTKVSETETVLFNTFAIKGMTLRDYFAAKAMQKVTFESGKDEENAKDCYAIADAMLKARGTQ